MLPCLALRLRLLGRKDRAQHLLFECQRKDERAETAHPCLCPHPSSRIRALGKRKIPSYLSAVTTPWGGERFSVLVPLYPLQLQVAEAGQG